MAISSPRNEKLKDLLKDFHTEVTNIPEYKQYVPEARPDYKRKDREIISENFQKKLDKILTKSQSELEYSKAGINNIKSGDLIKESFSSSALRLTASNEFQSAVLVAQMKPTNIEKIISDAVKQNRTEFVYSLATLLDAQELNGTMKVKLSHAMAGADLSFGVTDLKRQQETAQTYINEANTYSSLLQTDLAAFELRAKTETTIERQIADGKKQI